MGVGIVGASAAMVGGSRARSRGSPEMRACSRVMNGGARAMLDGSRSYADLAICLELIKRCGGLRSVVAEGGQRLGRCLQ